MGQRSNRHYGLLRPELLPLHATLAQPPLKSHENKRLILPDARRSKGLCLFLGCGDEGRGSIGRIIELHSTYYSLHWSLGLYFEAKVATELAEFMSRFQPERDGAWLARADDQIIGGVFIDGADANGEGARLRWFIVDRAY